MTGGAAVRPLGRFGTPGDPKAGGPAGKDRKKMKLKKVGALCKAARKCLLFDELSPEGEIVRQWISNGFAMWPVSGLPQLREANLSTLFDFSANATEKIHIKEQEIPGMLLDYLHDLRDGERELTESSVRIRVDGEELMALTTGADVIWLNVSLLTPCWTKETRLVARGGLCGGAGRAFPERDHPARRGAG